MSAEGFKGHFATDGSLLGSAGKCLWVKLWEELHLLTSKEISVEVEHLLAHRTEKGQERYVAF